MEELRAELTDLLTEVECVQFRLAKLLARIPPEQKKVELSKILN